MQHINIRGKKEKSKIGNYSEVRKQISDVQAKKCEDKSKIKAIDSRISDKMNITEPIED